MEVHSAPVALFITCRVPVIQLAMRAMQGWPAKLALVKQPAKPYVSVNRKTLTTKEDTMFTTVRKFARALRVPSAQDREMAYLNEARDRIDLEYRMRQVDRGMFRKSQF
jgi:hypothetical protein